MDRVRGGVGSGTTSAGRQVPEQRQDPGARLSVLVLGGPRHVDSAVRELAQQGWHLLSCRQEGAGQWRLVAGR